MAETSLIKYEKKSFFEKISDFLKTKFSKKKVVVPVVEISYAKDTKNEFDNTFEKKQLVLTLQKEYESGRILEEKMTKLQKDALINLYKEQILALQQEKEYYTKRLNTYKEKILLVKNGVE
ncbi:MAG: hypothetical protein IJS47_02420 [Clostridia bacterium]|nr:hypothetical protein [Clostridia bacterium]